MSPVPCTHAACEPLPGRYVDAADARIWTVEHGHGEPVVFLHCEPTTSYLWRHVQRALGSTYRTFAIDLPPLGSSRATDADWSPERQAERLEHWARQVGIDRFTLVAHDVGGAVAHHFAARYPQPLSALVLVDAVAFHEHWPVPLVSLLRVPLLGELVSLIGPHAAVFAQQIRAGFADAERLERCTLWRWYEPYSSPCARLRFVSFLGALDPDDVEAAIAAYAFAPPPTLVVWGEGDVYQPLAAGRRLHATLRGSSWFVIPDAGHFMPEEQPAQLAAAIDRFLGGSSR